MSGIILHCEMGFKGTDDYMDDNLNKLTLTISETARLLGIGRNTAYELARTGQLPALRLGKRLLVPRAALERLLHVVPPGD